MPETTATQPAASRVSSRPRYVKRFTFTERLLHWVHASAFFVLLGSGLVLYIPALSSAVGRRPLIKDIHFLTGVSWAGAMLLIVALGNRRAVMRTIREIDLFDRDDRRFLAGHARSPQGRFNAGQKVNAIITAAFAVLFFVSGMLLWLSERNTRFHLAGTLYLHDALMYLSVVIVVGHLYLSLIHRSTRHSLHGITLGTVREDWARTHHSKWLPSTPTSTPASPARHAPVTPETPERSPSPNAAKAAHEALARASAAVEDARAEDLDPLREQAGAGGSSPPG